MYLENAITFMDLRLLKSIVGQGYGSYLAKSLVNQLIEQNDKAFQIASGRQQCRCQTLV